MKIPQKKSIRLNTLQLKNSNLSLSKNSEDSSEQISYEGSNITSLNLPIQPKGRNILQRISLSSDATRESTAIQTIPFFGKILGKNKIPNEQAFTENIPRLVQSLYPQISEARQNYFNIMEQIKQQRNNNVVGRIDLYPQLQEARQTLIRQLQNFQELFATIMKTDFISFMTKYNSIIEQKYRYKIKNFTSNLFWVFSWYNEFIITKSYITEESKIMGNRERTNQTEYRNLRDIGPSEPDNTPVTYAAI